ncbi:FecR family protein [Novosphingobium sp. KN65.2]|uniref:FecR family protein n=1 Tax=Novosphingobium sp. KN65.2 TaxID=1478134 RepID=UPI000AA69228|nr:FecR domain-containing protein [Novosphingobium sp. KN65.2]
MTDRHSQGDGMSDRELAAFLRDPSGKTRPSGEKPQALQEAEDLWRSLDAVKDDPRILSMRSAARARLAANDGADEEDDSETEARSPRRTLAHWAPIAACLLLVFGLGSYIWVDRPGVTASQALQVLANGHEAPRAYRLADGSTVTLDAVSRVEVSLSNDARRLTLKQGRAFFDVAHDADRPFIVTSGDSSVTALGTRFMVSQRRDDPIVMLSQGKVRVADSVQTAELIPGEELSRDMSGSYIIAKSDPASVSEWTTGAVSFDAQPVSQVLEKLNPYLSRPLVLDDPADAQAQISGTFQLGNIRDIRIALEAMGIAVTQGQAPLAAQR